jgi:nitrogen regulatory protein PII
MKKIEAIINPSKIEALKNALAKIGIRRMTISKVDEFENQDGHIECYRGKEYMINVVKEFKIELIVMTDEMLSQVVETIEKTGSVSAEELFVFPMEEVNHCGSLGKGGRDEKDRSHCQTI